MTTSDFRKVLKQLNKKPPVAKKYMKHNAPKARTCGMAKHKCRRCGRNGGQVRKYGIDMCRQCFRELALKLGFKKYN